MSQLYIWIGPDGWMIKGKAYKQGELIGNLSPDDFDYFNTLGYLSFLEVREEE